MTLDEAIKYNEELKEGIDAEEMPEHYAAIQLGIEALKLVRRERLLGINPVEIKLPSETDD